MTIPSKPVIASGRFPSGRAALASQTSRLVFSHTVGVGCRDWLADRLRGTRVYAQSLVKTDAGLPFAATMLDSTNSPSPQGHAGPAWLARRREWLPTSRGLSGEVCSWKAEGGSCNLQIESEMAMVDSSLLVGGASLPALRRLCARRRGRAGGAAPNAASHGRTRRAPRGAWGCGPAMRQGSRTRALLSGSGMAAGPQSQGRGARFRQFGSYCVEPPGRLRRGSPDLSGLCCWDL